jgi:hypothetical protein
MGVKRGYLCKRCPLAFEIGGFFYWDLSARCEQSVCTACGTMHRLTDKKGVCQVTALAGPVRSLPIVTRRTSFGDEYEDYEWPFTEADWRAVGVHPGGIEKLEQLACSHCCAVARMQSLERPLHPDGNWVSFRDVCPLCGGPMPLLYDDTVN